MLMIAKRNDLKGGKAKVFGLWSAAALHGRGPLIGSGCR